MACFVRASRIYWQPPLTPTLSPEYKGEGEEVINTGMNPVQGVVAGIRQGQRWLLIRRSATVVRAPLKVCFPGGTIEPGETPRQAVVRELREELNIEIEPLRCCWQWEAPDRPLMLQGFLATISAGTPTPNAQEVAEILWLTTAEALQHADGLPSNQSFLAALEKE